MSKKGNNAGLTTPPKLPTGSPNPWGPTLTGIPTSKLGKPKPKGGK